jgi:hypothetical protein
MAKHIRKNTNNFKDLVNSTELKLNDTGFITKLKGLLLTVYNELVANMPITGWGLNGNVGTNPNTDFVGTTDGARLNVIGGGSSNVDVGVLISGTSQSEKGVLISGNSQSEEGATIEGTSQSREGVLIDGASQSGEGVLIDGYSLPSIASIHLKNNGGGIRLSGIDEGSDKILVSVDNNGKASWVSLNVAVFNFNEYVNDAAADADTDLPSRSLYKITGNRTVFQKP